MSISLLFDRSVCLFRPECLSVTGLRFEQICSHTSYCRNPTLLLLLVGWTLSVVSRATKKNRRKLHGVCCHAATNLTPVARRRTLNYRKSTDSTSFAVSCSAESTGFDHIL